VAVTAGVGDDGVCPAQSAADTATNNAKTAASKTHHRMLRFVDVCTGVTSVKRAIQ